MTQREPEIRSRKYLDGARGENCKLRFVGVCNHNPETVVACHVHDGNFGLSQKAHDVSIIDGCSACHDFLDHGWVGKISRTVRMEHVIRGLQETLVSRIRRGIVVIPLDPERLSHDKPVKPRKAPELRRKVPPGRKLQSRETEWPQGRKIPSRPKAAKGQP